MSSPKVPARHEGMDVAFMASPFVGLIHKRAERPVHWICVIIRIASGHGIRRGQLKPLATFCLN